MNQTKHVIDTMTYAASTDVEINLPTEGLITRIDLEGYITMSGAAATDIDSMGLNRFIQSIKVVGGGGRNYFAMSGVQMGLLLHFINLLDFPGTTWKSIVATSQYAGWRMHFGSRQRDLYGRDNPFDLTAAIPAHKEGKNQLKLIWTTPANSVIDGTGGSALTIATTSRLRATVHQVIGGEGAWRALGAMIPTSFSSGYDPLATKDALTWELDVPTGAFLRRIAVAAQDDSSVGTQGPLIVGDQATEIGLRLAKENRYIFRQRTKMMEVCGSPIFDGTVDATPNTQDPFTVAGFYCIDLRKHADKDYGLNLIGALDGDVKLAFTIGAYASGEVEQVWYDRVQPFS